MMTSRTKVKLLLWNTLFGAPCRLKSSFARYRASRVVVRYSRTFIFLLYAALRPLCILEMWPPSARGPTNTSPQCLQMKFFLLTSFDTLHELMTAKVDSLTVPRFPINVVVLVADVFFAAWIFYLIFEGRDLILEIGCAVLRIFFNYNGTVFKTIFYSWFAHSWSHLLWFISVF